MPQTLYLIDASIYIFRAYYSVPVEMSDAEGNPVNALQGFADFLGRFLAKTRAAHVAVAFDESLTSSFRNDLYPDYKANRERPPEDLKLQLDRCRTLVKQAGLASFASNSLEADDLIGCLAALGRQQGFRNVILTADKDLAQLLRGEDQLWDFAKDRVYGVADIPAWLGVEAHQVADRLAITGDAVDNIPGVPGIGPKGASALLQHFGSLDAIYADIDAVAELPVRGAARLQRLLSEHEQQARLARKLTGIVEDAELGVAVEELAPNCRDQTALGEWCSAAGIAAVTRHRLVQALAT